MVTLVDEVKMADNTNYTIRYRIKATLFTEDGQNQFEPVRIDGLINNVDYSKSFTPLMTLTIQVVKGHARILKDNENRMLLSLNLTKVKYVSEKESLVRSEVESEVVFDKIFVPIIESEDIRTIEKFEDTVNPDATIEDSVSGEVDDLTTVRVRMYINTLDYHLMYKKTYNTVLRGKNNGKITIDTALRYICETCGAKGYIIDKPDNVIPFENIIIPPGNVKYCIDVLQTLYGVYLKDILSFYDFDDKLYILSRLSKEHDIEKDKVKEVNLLISTTTINDSLIPGLVQYQDGNVIQHTMMNNLTDTSVGIASGEAFGDSIVFTNYGFASETFEYEDGKLKNVKPSSREYLRNALSHSHTGMGLSFEYDELNNSFNMFSNLNSMGITSIYIVKTEGMDLDCLKPNVIYSINLVSRNEEDNDRFVNKKFPILQYVQEFRRDNDIVTNDIFKTFETISLAANDIK